MGKSPFAFSKNAVKVYLLSDDKNVNSVLSFCATFSDSLGRMKVEIGWSG